MRIKKFQGSPGVHAAGAVAWALAAAFALTVMPAASAAEEAQAQGSALIKNKNIDVSRVGATQEPRSEADQALAEGWPLYRTDRGQEAFNAVMAALAATEGTAPGPKAFGGCPELMCQLTLPAIGSDGWIPPGRIWLSPTQYVLFVHSPRLPEGQAYDRRGFKSMRIFVFHEFQNNNYNTDLFDTLSSHSRSVFVPLYMSKEATDARGRRFVTVVQVAPYDVVSRHAANWGSAGPGMEVAKNTADEMEPLQGQAGIVVATMIKTAAPHLRVVNHRNVEGRPMLDAYDRRLAILGGRPNAATVALPFVPAEAGKIAAAAGSLDDLIARGGVSPPLAVAQRSFVPKVAAARPPAPTLIGPIRLAMRRVPAAEPKLIGPIRVATRPAAPADDALER